MPTYLTSLRVAANSAAAPASRAASETYDSARGQDTVTSQHNDLPLYHGTSVRPFGLFPSDRNSPMGSLVTGTPAEAKLRAIKSLSYYQVIIIIIIIIIVVVVVVVQNLTIES